MLGRAGYEIRRKDSSVADSRNTMWQALHWIQDHGFSVKTVLDVGASDGRWSKDCMAFFPDARFVLFEPQPVHSQALDAFAGSSSGRVIPVRKAVGAEDGHLLFDVSAPFGGGPATHESEKIMEVDQTTLDSSTLQLQLEEPFLLKLDTHGFEKSILQGADQTLEKSEVLIIEAYNYRITDEALLFWELCAFLAERGFRPVDIVDLMRRKYDNSLWQMDLIFIRSSWEGFNRITYT